VSLTLLSFLRPHKDIVSRDEPRNNHPSILSADENYSNSEIRQPLLRDWVSLPRHSSRGAIGPIAIGDGSQDQETAVGVPAAQARCRQTPTSQPVGYHRGGLDAPRLCGMGCCTVAENSLTRWRVIVSSHFKWNHYPWVSNPARLPRNRCHRSSHTERVCCSDRTLDKGCSRYSSFLGLFQDGEKLACLACRT
jgi:hypothetical protein